MNTPMKRRVPRVVLALFALVTLTVFALATPQGRTFAQAILQLFNRAEETSFPLSHEQIPAQPESDQITAAPPSRLISVAEAEAQVRFDIAELSFVPEGFDYLGARLYGNVVNLEYQTPDLGGHLIIVQSQAGYNESEWDSVPDGAVVPVKIGDLDGKFVQGTFVVYPNATEVTWNPDAAMWRLRWEKDGMYYEIGKFGNVQAIEYLDQAGLVRLAEDLMRK